MKLKDVGEVLPLVLGVSLFFLFRCFLYNKVSRNEAVALIQWLAERMTRKLAKIVNKLDPV